MSLFVVAPNDGNEIILTTAIHTLEQALYDVMGDKDINEDNIMRNYLMVATTFSEIVDNGYLLTDTVPQVF